MGSLQQPGATTKDSQTLSALTADAKLFLGGQIVRPFLQAGIGGYAVSEAGFGEAYGSGFQAGGGLDFHLTPQLALSARVLYRGIGLGDAGAHTGEYLGLVTGEAGLAVHF
jgi:opacity protein-like surface antigen